MEELLTTDALVSLLTLSFLEIVLGIDNIVFISIVAARMPLEQQKKVRVLGLTLALVGRLVLLLAISWVIGLNKPVITINDFALSFRDIILIVGGMFLVAKSTSEIHQKIQPGEEDSSKDKKALTLRGAIIQIIILDLVFSLDSIITAVGLVDNVVIIVVAIVIAMGVMLTFARRISEFIHKNPAMKLLALSFLLMIGSILIIEGFHVHVPKGYIYFSMAFAVIIELINIKIRKKNPMAIH